MKENVLLDGQQASGNEFLKLTALLYLKEALDKQEYESCRVLVDTAKELGVGQGEISAAIAEYLNAENQQVNKPRRLRPYKEV